MSNRHVAALLLALMAPTPTLAHQAPTARILTPHAFGYIEELIAGLTE